MNLAVAPEVLLSGVGSAAILYSVRPLAGGMSLIAALSGGMLVYSYLAAPAKNKTELLRTFHGYSDDNNILDVNSLPHDIIATLVPGSNGLYIILVQGVAMETTTEYLKELKALGHSITIAKQHSS